MIDNGAQAIVDEIASDSEAQRQPDQGNDGDPFLPWVLVCLPRMVDIALLHPSRTEVFLVLPLMMKVNGGRILGSAQGCRVEGIPWGLVDVVTASVTCRLDGASSIWGLLWGVVWGVHAVPRAWEATLKRVLITTMHLHDERVWINEREEGRGGREKIE